MEASQQDHTHNPENPISRDKANSIQDPNFFAFLNTDEERPSNSFSIFFSENGLREDIIQVTQAEPDICLEVFYALENTLWPQIENQPDVSFKDAWRNFIGGSIMKGSLCPPEKLILERRVKDIKRTMSGAGGENQIFQDLDEVVNSIINLKQKINGFPGEILYKKEVEKSLDLVREFYLSYKNKVKGLFQAILDKEKINVLYTSESEELEDLLEPKAVMMSDIFAPFWAFRIPRSQAQRLLSLNASGRNLKSNIKDPSNHRVIALPENSDKPLAFFKANGNPPIQPEKEFMLYSLYQHLQIPVPETALLILTDVFDANPGYFYAVQASEAVIGESALKVSRDPETIFDHGAYVSQTIGAFLTNPSDGSFKNFKYSPEYQTFISIDNDEVFKSEIAGLDDKEIVNVKSILYLLPQIDLPIPESVQTHFSTLDPHLITFAWLQGLIQKNKEYNLLFQKLAFQKTRCIYQNLLPQSEVPSLSKCLQQKIQVDPDLHCDSFRPQILVSQNLLKSLTEKLQLIEKTLLQNRAVSTQILFKEISPLLEKYYRKLRSQFNGPEEALAAVWGPQKNGVDYSKISSLLDHEELNNLSSRKNQFSENQTPEIFLKEYKYILSSGQSALDSFIKRHSERKNKNVLNLQVALNELRLLIQEGLINSQSPRDIVDFCHALSKLIESDHSLLKEITSILSNLPNAELKWLLTLEKYFFRADCDASKDLMPSSVPVFGAFMKQRIFIVSESDHHYLFDHKGNIQRNFSLPGRSSVTCFPEENPEFYLKQYPEWPGYEFASTLFMRLLGVQHLPYHDLAIMNDYPVLLTQQVVGDPVLHIWDNAQAFHNLDPVQTGLLIISAMLLNPEDGKEDNFILSPDEKYLVPIDNDHCFLPSFSQKGSFWNPFTVNTTLQTKTLLFCLDEMYMFIPLEVRNHVLSIDFNSLLKSWMAELDKIENKFNNLVDQNLRNTFLEQGTVMRIPFYKQFIQNLHWKAHTIQDILKTASTVTPFDLLKAVEPFAAKCYEDSFKQGFSLQSRFIAATNQLYKKSAFDERRVSIVNTRTMMEIINVSEKDLQTDIMFQRMGPVDAFELLNQLIKEHSKKTTIEQEILCELDEKEQEKKWISFFGDSPTETALKAFFANPKEGLALKGSKLITSSKLIELFAQTPDKGVKIRFLSFLESPLLTGREIRILAEECPNIEYLNVSSCIELEQIITTEGEWPLLTRLEAKDCLNLKKIVSYSPMKILRVETVREIEIFVEKPTLALFTISKKETEFEISFRKGENPEIKSQGQTFSNQDFLHHFIREKEEIMKNFSNFKITLEKHSILSGKDLAAFVIFLHLKNSSIKIEDIKRVVQLNFINLTSLNLSQNKTMGVNSLKYLIQGDWPKLNHLDLSVNTIQDEGVAILSRGNWPLLKTLNLSETKITEVGIEIIANQTDWTQLKHLDLSHNEVCDEGLETLSKANWPLLESLNLKYSFISKKKFLHFILNVKWSNLKEVCFDFIGRKASKNLLQKNWYLLEELNLSHSEITQNELEVIVNKCKWPQLKNLNVCGNKICDEGVELLSKGNWPLLETLDLSFTNMTTGGVEVLVNRTNWPQLKHLDLSGNGIFDKGLETLSQANWPLLESLSLSQSQITKKKLFDFIFKTKFFHLKKVFPDSIGSSTARNLLLKDWYLFEELNLSHSEITQSEIKILVNKCNWPRLKDLNLSHNEIFDEGIEVLSLGNWPLLETLDLSNTNMTTVGVEMIGKKNCCPQLKRLDLSHNNINDEALKILCQGNFPLLEILRLTDTEITKKALHYFLLNADWPYFRGLGLPNDWDEIDDTLISHFIRKDLSELEKLDLNLLKITLAEIQPIMKRNEYKCPRLNYLRLFENDISFERNYSVLVMIECPLLEELHLEKTKLSLKEIEAIVQAKWPNLKHLNVSNNEIFDEGLSGLIFADWPLIEELNLKNTKITLQGLETHIYRMKQPNLRKLDVSEDDIFSEALKTFPSEKLPLFQYLNKNYHSFEENLNLPVTVFDMSWLGSRDIHLSTSLNERIFMIPRASWDQIESMKLSFNDTDKTQPFEFTVWPPNLKILDVSNNSLAKLFENSFFENCPLLEELCLQKTDITTKGIENLVSRLNWSNLRKLDISLNPLRNEGFEVLAQGNWPLIEILNLSKTGMTAVGIEAIVKQSKWPKLRRLNFSDNEICDEGIKILASANWPLLDLHFRDTSMTTKSIEIFMNIRSQWPNLNRVDVSHNPIQNEGLEMIASSNWTQLESLNLENTEITDKGIRNLIKKSHWPNFKALDISDNEIGDEGLRILSFGKWPQLENLYLRKLKIAGPGVQKMIRRSEWPHLKTLDLSDNQIWNKKFGALEFKKWSFLESLNLKNTGITKRDIHNLTPQLSYFHLKEIHLEGLRSTEARRINLYTSISIAWSKVKVHIS